MADVQPGPRTLTEDQAYAIVADRVQRETADYKAQIETLGKEKAELQSKLDVADAAVKTEKTARETAEKALTDYKTSIETEKAQAARSVERVAKVKEVAKHLGDDFYTDERKLRWAAMEDDAFSSYVSEMAAACKDIPAPGSTGTGAPRETAMVGAAPVAPSGGSAAQRMFDLRRGVSA